jgi:hypothetical protein
MMRDIQIIQRELPIDLLEFHCLTPLPGSEDHQKLHKGGRVSRSRPEQVRSGARHREALHHDYGAVGEAYHDAWTAYYSPEHIRTVMRRSVATNSNAGNMMFLLLWYTCVRSSKRCIRCKAAICGGSIARTGGRLCRWKARSFYL